jgi:uncharacterized protein (TIGR01244 family)
MKAFLALIATLFLASSHTALAQSDLGIPYQKSPRSNLIVGGQPTLVQLKAAKERGFSTIINLRPMGEFDDFDEAAEVKQLGMEYVHIPIDDIESIKPSDAEALHNAITQAAGPVLLHCTVGWRAGGLFAIENYLLHDASKQEALDLAAEAHMSHAVGNVEERIEENQ